MRITKAMWNRCDYCGVQGNGSFNIIRDMGLDFYFCDKCKSKANKFLEERRKRMSG